MLIIQDNTRCNNPQFDSGLSATIGHQQQRRRRQTGDLSPADEPMHITFRVEMPPATERNGRTMQRTPNAAGAHPFAFIGIAATLSAIVLALVIGLYAQRSCRPNSSM